MLTSNLTRLQSGKCFFAQRVAGLLARELPVLHHNDSISNDRYQRASSKALSAWSVRPRNETFSWQLAATSQIRNYSGTAQIAPSSHSNRNGNHHRKKRRGTSTNATEQEMKVRDTTLRILQLGEQAKSSATSVDTMAPNLRSVVGEQVFWTEADHAVKWWIAQTTPESVDVSFQLLDALADLSSIAQDPQLSSVILNTKTLNKVVMNWLQTWQHGGDLVDNKMTTPDGLFQKLEKYRQESQDTSWTRRKLKPNLETYHLLMEGSATRNDKQPGFNESVMRHLMEQTHDQSIQPTLKTLAHIIHGLSSRGQVVSKEELEQLLSLLQQLGATKNNPMDDDNGSDNLKPIDLFNTAIFALADTKSDVKDARSAEKMLLILNFMQTIAEEYPDMAKDIHPDLDTYNVVLNGFSRAGKGAQAEMVLQDMVSRYENAQTNPQEVISSLAVKPVPKSFTIVITAYGNSEETRNAEKAEGILRWQQHLNEEKGPLQGCITPETITYNNVIRAWSWRRSHEAVERCDELRKKMHKHKIAPNEQTYGQSLKCIALSNMKEKGRYAVQVWREMEFHRIEPNDYVRKYFEKCVAVRSKKSDRRKGTRSPNPQRAPRPFD